MSMDIIHHYFERQPPFRIAVISLAMIVLVGVSDYLIHPDLSFSIFYVLPIGFAAWYGSKRTGTLIVIIAAMTWLVSYSLSGGHYSYSAILYWNTIVRFAFFYIIANLLSRLNNKLKAEKEMADTDPLTGVLNSRSFYERAATEAERSYRYLHPFTIAYLDLDNFKVVNDTYGHTIGDDLLKKVASILKTNTRKTDYIARLGGDEFIILFNETDTKAASEAVQHLQKYLLKEMNEVGWPVTFSIGMITYKVPPPTVRQMLKNVDDLMYSVKREGKNSFLHETWAGDKPYSDTDGLVA
jgi:diguanylate cyclase (GGDEF)-like protein